MIRPPDLQELVQAYGGYDHIPPAAWAEYDAAVSKWHANRRAEIREKQSRNQHSARSKRRQLNP